MNVMNNLDDFLFEYGKVRYVDGKVKIDLDLRYSDVRGAKIVEEAKQVLQKRKLLGSTISVGY